VEAPTLYHRYGDKNGLLDALVAKGVKTFLKRKQAGPDTADALADLIRDGKVSSSLYPAGLGAASGRVDSQVSFGTMRHLGDQVL
jgi:hypothetical protein